MFNILLLLWFLQGEYFGKRSHAPTISKVFAYIVVYILHLVFNYVYLFLINELIFVSGKSFETVFFQKSLHCFRNTRYEKSYTVPCNGRSHLKTCNEHVSLEFTLRHTQF